MSNQELPKDVLIVRSLMVLRNVSAQSLATHAGVQIENLYSWLDGTASALSKKSYISLLSYLGLTSEGFSKSFVQNWSLTVGSSFSKEQLQILHNIGSCVVGGAMIEITGEWQPLYGKQRVYAIRGDNFKILLSLKGGFRMPFNFTPDNIPNICWRASDDNKEPVILVDSLYWNAVRNQAITPAEFDDLFFETALKCSWNDLRLMARERGITPSMLAKDILSKDIQQESSVSTAAESEQEQRIAIPVEAQSHAVTAPRTRRRSIKAQPLLNNSDSEGDSNLNNLFTPSVTSVDFSPETTPSSSLRV